MPYGTLKCDTITFTSSGVDKSVSISGLVQNPTFSGNITSTGTISGVTIQGGTLVSGATVTGSAGQFTTITGGTAGFTTVTGTTVTGTTANFTTVNGGTVSLSSGVFAAGTAAAPSITFTGDSNTGLYSPGADQLAISTGGTGRLFVDSFGKVGIGAVSTGSKLFVDGDAIIGPSPDTNGYLSIDGASGAYLNLTATIGYISADSTLVFNTASSERLRITSDGKVGVGTSSPVYKLDIHSVAGDGIQIFELSSGANKRLRLTQELEGVTYNATFSTVGNAHIWQVGNNEFARIDSSGRLLVGTSSSQDKFYNSTGVNHKLQIETTTAYAQSWVSHGTSAGFGAHLTVGRSRGTSAGSVTVVQADDTLGHLSFQGADGAEFVEAARIQAYVDGTPGANDMPGRLVFFTTADGASSPTERMRITSAGFIGIGTVSPQGPLHVEGISGSDTVRLVGRSSQSSVLAFYNNAATTGRFIIGQGYTTGSDNIGFIVNGANADLVLGTNNTERARIDSSGRLLVGTSTARSADAYGSAGLQVESTAYQTSSISAINNQNSSDGVALMLGKSRGTAIGSNTIVQSGDTTGFISFQGADGTGLKETANIFSVVDGTPGANDMPGRLVFSTTADGASSPTEAMRINNQRELLIGTTTRTANGGVLQVSNGITFPATQSACSDANTLDDYEEGTFTPTVIGTTIAGTASYTTQTGRYTKFGRLVQFEIYVFWGGGTGTGNLRIAGLPFTCNNGSTFPAVTIAGQNNVASSANTYLNAYIQQSTTEVLIQENPTGGGARASVAYDADGELLLSGTYSI